MPLPHPQISGSHKFPVVVGFSNGIKTITTVPLLTSSTKPTTWSYLFFLSSMSGGLVFCALSPIRVPTNFPTRVITSPVASSRARRSINDRSTLRTRLEFCKWKNVNSILHFWIWPAAFRWCCYFSKWHVWSISATTVLKHVTHGAFHSTTDSVWNILNLLHDALILILHSE